MANKRKKKNRHNIYSERITVRMKKREKRFLFDLCREHGTSYSALIRGALHEMYPIGFDEYE